MYNLIIPWRLPHSKGKTKMLDSLLLLKSLEDAIRIIRSARVEVSGGSNAIWNKLHNSHDHLDKQIVELLSDN